MVALAVVAVVLLVGWLLAGATYNGLWLLGLGCAVALIVLGVRRAGRKS